MIKYRRLNLEELQSMEREFVLFLVTQGVEAGQWNNIKDTDSTKADDLIDLFSNHVFEKITSQTDYLDLMDMNKAIFIHCKPSGMSRMCLADSTEGTGDVLSQLLDPEYQLPIDLEVLYDDVPYSDDGRNHDVYKLLSLGFVKSKGQLYKKISVHYASTNSTE